MVNTQPYTSIHLHVLLRRHMPNGFAGSYPFLPSPPVKAGHTGRQWNANAI